MTRAEPEYIMRLLLCTLKYVLIIQSLQIFMYVDLLAQEMLNSRLKLQDMFGYGVNEKHLD